MKSGSREIQQRMKQQVPFKPEGELKKEWFPRAARFYEITQVKAENLFYRKGHDIPNEVYEKLKSYPLSNPIPGSGENFHDEIDELEKELRLQRQKIESLEGQLKRDREFRQKVGELFAS